MCDHCGCREFEPIQELTGEHEEILRLAWLLAEAADAGRDAPAEELRLLRGLLDVHVLKEETGLYPELVGLDGLSDTDCAALEEEHRELFDALDRERFDRRDYFALAAHIEVEEMELFSAARFRFDDGDWNDMGAAHHAAEHALGRPHSHPVDVAVRG